MIKKKVSLIGFGSIGKKHFSSLRKFIPEKNIQIISSQDLEIENISKNIQDLDKFDPDIIIDCTPTYQHLENCNYIEKSLKNKRILVEKPIFVKKEQFSRENCNQYFCAYNLRFHPFIEIIKEIVPHGNGTSWTPSRNLIEKIKFNCLSYLPNWRKKDYRKSYSSDAETGGGVALELSHEIDLALSIFGSLQTKKCVYKKQSDLDIQANDFLFLDLDTKNKIKCEITLDIANKNEQRDITLFSNEVKINFDFLTSEIKNISPETNTILDTKKTNFFIQDTYDEQIKSLLDNDVKKICTLEEALKVLEFIEGLQDNE